ncbi:hypothetical protein HELRODRAFT_96557 [Helobdella robusta]|uniref:Guanylate cyclase n=1 Tax=Helobdella robusta TaxID=6412 RepID=T1G9C9_HELRO|nr:hypothetical protein HELRODRAFT_96557 [Helobdella robusta]ESN90567.1 hypothetical protein HELRODRAFT_96557 [Helobdella robusta]
MCASNKVIRNIMLVADEMGFNNGEYIFINIDLFSNKQTLERPWFQLDEAKEKNDRARKAFESMLTVTATKKDSQEYRQFSEEVRKRSVQMYQKDVYGDEVNDYVGSFHDALLLYSLAVNETIQAGLSPRDGQEITKRMWNKTFKGITGLVSIDQNGDREEDYSILNMNPEDGVFRVIGNYLGRQKVFEKVEGSPIFWPGNRTDPPPDIPKCGFDGKGCPPKEKLPVSAFVAVALSIILLIVLLVVLILYRRMKEEAELSEVHWRVKWEEITSPNSELHMDRVGSMHSLVSHHASFDTLAVSETGPRQIFTKTGHYKSTVVAIKTFDRPFNSTKPLLISIKKLRDLTNDHVARFIGVCIDPPNQSIITEYCQKGSLQDVLENDSIKLDRMFKFSLIQDLIRGMCYLHSSDIKYHGNLKSSNCVVDSRFVLKVTDFGLLELRSRRSSHDVDSFAYYRSKLWTAPEILRMEDSRKCADSTSRINLYEKSHGDVYSFAIICQEVVHRKGVFWVRNVENISPHEIYLLVKSDKKPCFRPTLLQYGDDSDDTCADDLCTLIQKSWTEDPNERPEFNQIKNSVKRMNKDMGGGNLLDNLLSRMEQYACNLEGLVQERTADYLEQKKRAENLLYMMLPRSVATQLMQGMNVKAEKYESVTIYFSDICGFTSLSALSTPMQVVDLLNDLYTSFDVIIEKFDVYKVETIGDAYMVVSGLPVRNGLLHAREICRMSLKLLKEVKSFKIRHMPSDKLMLRIGVHSGAVCAGVVGHKMPRYCLFGDTVNTASRMESNGEALKIHVSPETKATLDMFGTFKLEFRGPVVMKGKGEICTWWLMGEENPEFPELSPAEMHL